MTCRVVFVFADSAHKISNQHWPFFGSLGLALGHYQLRLLNHFMDCNRSVHGMNLIAANSENKHWTGDSPIGLI